MDDLPTEIKEMICNNCNFMTLKNLRLTSRSYTQLTTPRIFKDFYMGFSLMHLQRLMDLSETPRISKLVQNFFFVGEIVPEFDTQKKWEFFVNLRQSFERFSWGQRQQQATGGQMTDREIKDMHKKLWKKYDQRPRHMLSASDLSHHFQRYNSFRQQQLAWGEVEDRLFIDAFTRLPSLISVSNGKYPWKHARNANLGPPWRSLRRKILVCPHDWRGMYYRSVQGKGQKPLIMRHALCLVKGLSQRSKRPDVSQIVNLSLENTGIQSFFDQTGLVDTGSPRAQVPEMHGFEHLVFMELYVSYNFDVEQSDRSAASLGSEVQSILEAARNLRHLKLVLHDAYSHHYYAEDMSQRNDFLSNFTPPQLPVLHTLELTCTTSRKLLNGFLQTYAASLRNLRLVSCTMSEGSTWESVIRELPSILTLEEVYFARLTKFQTADFPNATFFLDECGMRCKDAWDVLECRNQDKAVYDYVLGKSGELPLLKEQAPEGETL